MNRLYRLYRRCNGVYSLAHSADRPYVSPTSQFVHAQNAPRPDSRFHLQGSSPTWKLDTVGGRLRKVRYLLHVTPVTDMRLGVALFPAVSVADISSIFDSGYCVYSVDPCSHHQTYASWQARSLASSFASCDHHPNNAMHPEPRPGPALSTPSPV